MMTEISVGLLEGRTISLSAAGHSGYSEKGQDIVCAGVSALVQALLYGFETVLRVEGLTIEIDDERAVISIDWRNCTSGDMDILVETIVGSLKKIAGVYPDHVRILEVHPDEMEF